MFSRYTGFLKPILHSEKKAIIAGGFVKNGKNKIKWSFLTI